MEKEKFTLEFTVKSSTRILYNCFSSPSGLSEWFCNDVNIKNDVYTFIWDQSEEQAILKGKKANEYIRFQWMEDEGTDAYFEFRIQTDPLTKENALMITDFAEPDEQEEAILLWESQVGDLKLILGS